MEEFGRKNPTTSIITPVLNQTMNYLKSEQSLKTFIKLSMPISILPLEDQFQLGKMNFKQFQVVKDIL